MLSLMLNRGLLERSTREGDLERWCLFSYSLLMDRVDNTLTSIKQKNNNINMDKNLAYLLGALRDGHLYNNRIEFFSKSKEWMTELADILKQCSNKEASISLVKDIYWKCRLQNKKFYQELLKISEFKVPQSFWETPKAILNASKDLQRYYIGGFFDAEGCVSLVQKKYLNVEFYHSWNHEFSCPPLEDIKKILNKNNIKTSKVFIIKRPTIGRNYPLFRLIISNKKGIENFSKWIYSFHINKRKRLYCSTL